MSKCHICVALFVCLTGPLAAQSRAWTPTNAALASSAALAILSDWTTTVDMVRHGDLEGGPGRFLIGRRPQLATVNRVFALNALLVGVVATRLPPRWRNVLLGAVVLGEGYYGVVHNHYQWGRGFNLHF